MTDRIPPDIFPAVLGGAFEALPLQVRAAHLIGGGLRLSGRAHVTRGPTLWARLLAGLFRFPPAADDMPVSVTMTPHRGGETWVRQFGDRKFQSFLIPFNGEMTETFGPFTFRLGLQVDKGALHFPVLAGRLGPLALPRMMLPQSIAREFAHDGRFHFDVALHAPLTGKLMVHYQGWLVPAKSGRGD